VSVDRVLQHGAGTAAEVPQTAPASDLAGLVIAPSQGFWRDLRADHAAILASERKYSGRGGGGSWLLVDVVRRIGLQMMAAYRLMRACRALRLTPLAMILSRLIRHLYGAEIHWDAELAPGVVLVHGTALVLSREARVGSGCILFQSVTLGVSIDPVTRRVGGPTLGPDVHVGPGAALLGPITVGAGSKVMANAVLMVSVPPDSLVEVSAPTIRPRSTRAIEIN
jgi:serine acetyltransferase